MPPEPSPESTDPTPPPQNTSIERQTPLTGEVVPPTPPIQSPREIRLVAESYEGNVAHPDILEKFERVVPGSAKRMIDWTDDEIFHRRHMETIESERAYELEKLRIEKSAEVQAKAIEAENAVVATLGQTQTNIGCGGHAVALSAIVGSVMLALAGHSQESVMMIGSTAVIYTGGYIFNTLAGRKTNKAAREIPVKKAEEEEKDEED